MVNITLKNIPEQLHKELCSRAEKNGRSLNKEVIASLESIVKSKRIDPLDYLQYIRKARDKAKLNITNEDITSAIDNGRE